MNQMILTWNANRIRGNVFLACDELFGADRKIFNFLVKEQVFRFVINLRYYRS